MLIFLPYEDPINQFLVYFGGQTSMEKLRGTVGWKFLQNLGETIGWKAVLKNCLE